MTFRKYIYTLVCLYLCSTFDEISADEACDKSRCKGPVKYYEDLQCTPIYDADDSCCAVKYNCDHLKGRSEDKCYYKGHTYELGEKLRAEDAQPCDISCYCNAGWNSAAHFSCAIVVCSDQPGPGCYLKQSHDRCCLGPEVCTRNGTESIAKCEVDGRTYLDGQRFTPESDPTLSCICAEGYTGENVAPFCKTPVPSSCGVELRHANEIYENCAPAFCSMQNPATDCNVFFRCQNDNDTVVEQEDTTTDGSVTSAPDPDSTCTFGQLTMKKGDELNQETDWSSFPLKCVCEVPPIPTCQRLPEGVCFIYVYSRID